jgi:CRISPR-associated protein Cas1
MRKLLNTLYIISPDSYISRDGLNIVIIDKESEKIRLPIHNIESIVTMGYKGMSPGAMGLCVDNGVSVVFLSSGGRYLARIEGPIKGNVVLRKKQYANSSDNLYSIALSKIIVAGKIQNYKNILNRYIRDYGSNIEIEQIIQKLAHRIKSIPKVDDLDVLRGIEGLAAKEYFSVFHYLILSSESFTFVERNRRPPKDPINAMLSFVYTLIANQIQAALESVGLDPYVGFFHTLRPGRASLALDMMEEFRAYLGDRLVLSLINRKQVHINGFKYQGEENVVMDDDTKKIILGAWQKRKKDVINHPFLGENIPIGLLPYAQAMLLARYLRNDLDNYPVFINK